MPFRGIIKKAGLKISALSPAISSIDGNEPLKFSGINFDSSYADTPKG